MNTQITKLELSAEIAKHAESIGNAIGKYSKATRVQAEAMRAAAIVLLQMPVPEGIVGNVGPMQELFLFTIRAKAWAAGPYAKEKMEVSKDQVLSNSLSRMRKIARAATLSGHISWEDGTVITDTKDALMRILNRSGDSAGSGFNPAVAKAIEFEKRARARALKDPEFARLIGKDPAKLDGGRGRPSKEPSDARIDAATDMIRKCGVDKLDKLVATAFDSLVTQTNQGDVQAEVKALLNKALGLVKQAETLIRESRVLKENQPLAELDEAIRAVQQSKVATSTTPAPTHTDEVTVKRAARKSARKSAKAVDAETGSMPMAQEASA